MATWNSRGLRGSTLEEFINHTNTRYSEMGLALIQKIPTPITPVRIDKEHRHITLAYFDKISTVDYIGAVQGIPVCFDAKECNADTFPLQNVHEHQIHFMEKFEQQGGISFLLIYFTARFQLIQPEAFSSAVLCPVPESADLPVLHIVKFLPGWFMKLQNGFFIPYLDYIQKDLDTRD